MRGAARSALLTVLNRMCWRYVALIDATCAVGSSAPALTAASPRSTSTATNLRIHLRMQKIIGQAETMSTRLLVKSTKPPRPLCPQLGRAVRIRSAGERIGALVRPVTT